MKPKCPEWLHRWQAYALILILRDRLESAGGPILILTAQEVKINAATDGAVRQSLIAK